VHLENFYAQLGVLSPHTHNLTPLFANLQKCGVIYCKSTDKIIIFAAKCNALIVNEKKE